MHTFKLPRSTSFPLVIFFAISYFFFEGTGGGILPVDYSVLIFALSVAIASLFLARPTIDKAVFKGLTSLAFTALVSTAVSGVPSAPMYMIGPTLLLLVSSNAGIGTGESSRTYGLFLSTILLAFGTIILFTMERSHENRYFLPWIGNPNYTSMVYLGALISIDTIGRHVSFPARRTLQVYSWLLFLAVVYLTQTRSVALAALIYLFTVMLITKKANTLARLFVAGLVILSAFGQLAAYFLFLGVKVHPKGRSPLGLVDESNMQRFSAYMSSLEIALSDYKFIYTGLGSVENIWLILEGQISNVPHNWFMMMIISNGLAFTGTIFLVLLFSAHRLSLKFLPGFAAILIIAFLIGRAALFAPLILFMLAALISNRCTQQTRR